MVLVSVIIPAYNSESTIQATLDSVRAQSYTQLEIIVIDDGSQDSTVEIVASVAKLDARIRWFSYSNAGPAIARNRGIEKATGDFLSFMDADDLWTTDKIEAQLAQLKKCPEAGLAYSFVNWIDGSDEFLRPGSHVKANGYALEQLLVGNFIDNGSNVLIRRDVISAVGKFNPQLPPSEDWDMWLRIAALYQFACIPKVQVLYRVLPTSLSSNVKKLSDTNLAVLDKFFSHHPDLKVKLGTQAYADRYRYFTFKSIEGAPSRQNGWLALKFFFKAVSLEPAWWIKRIKLVLIVLIKASFFTLVPTQAKAS